MKRQDAKQLDSDIQAMEGRCAEDEMNAAFYRLFQAYDVDDSGFVSLRGYLKMHIRQCLYEGREFEPGTALTWMSTAKREDEDPKLQLDSCRFQEHQISWYKESEKFRTNWDLVRKAHDDADQIFSIRSQMGARFDAKIRYALKDIFASINDTKDGKLKPGELILARTYVQPVLMARRRQDLVENWFGEIAFLRADCRHDGFITMQTFLEISFAAFEAEYRSGIDACGEMVEAVLRALRATDPSDLVLSVPVDVYSPFKKRTFFFSPENATVLHHAHGKDFKKREGVQIPMSLTKPEDLASIMRMHLHLKPGCLLSSIFCSGGNAARGPRDCTQEPECEQEDICRAYVTLMTPSRSLADWTDDNRIGSIKASLALCQQPMRTGRGFYIKNVRSPPQNLMPQSVSWLSDDPALAQRIVDGPQFCFNWKAQLLGIGVGVPTAVKCHVNDTIIIEVPQTSADGAFRYTYNVLMESPGTVLAYPRAMIALPAQRRQGRPKSAGKQKHGQTIIPLEKLEAPTGAEDGPQPPVNIALCVQNSGVSSFCVEVCWESCEGEFAEDNKHARPLSHNSIGRIGPILVKVLKEKDRPFRRELYQTTAPKKYGTGDVQETTAPKKHSKSDTLQKWWNGGKWVSQKMLGEKIKKIIAGLPSLEQRKKKRDKRVGSTRRGKSASSRGRSTSKSSVGTSRASSRKSSCGPSPDVSRASSRKNSFRPTSAGESSAADRKGLFVGRGLDTIDTVDSDSGLHFIVSDSEISDTTTSELPPSAGPSRPQSAVPLNRPADHLRPSPLPPRPQSAPSAETSMPRAPEDPLQQEMLLQTKKPRARIGYRRPDAACGSPSEATTRASTPDSRPSSAGTTPDARLQQRPSSAGVTRTPADPATVTAALAGRRDLRNTVDMAPIAEMPRECSTGGDAMSPLVGSLAQANTVTIPVPAQPPRRPPGRPSSAGVRRPSSAGVTRKPAKPVSIAEDLATALVSISPASSTPQSPASPQQFRRSEPRIAAAAWKADDEASPADTADADVKEDGRDMSKMAGG